MSESPTQLTVESTSSTSGSSSPATPSSDAIEVLSHLHKMSGTGSAFGQADYVAINPLAVVALVLAMVGLFSLLFAFFLASAVIAIAIGAIALRQITNSNGTQTGKGIAIGAILLALLIGVGVGAREVSEWRQHAEDARTCDDFLHRFAETLGKDDLDGAYKNFTTENFREKVDPALFKRDLRALMQFGHIEWISCSDVPVQLTPIPDTDARQADLRAKIKFDKGPEPLRQVFTLTNREDGSWKIDDIPGFFRKPRAAGEEPPQ